jgi:hypothetical protein
MKLAAIGLATALALASTAAALAQGGPASLRHDGPCGSQPCGVTTGSIGTSLGTSLGNEAGSAAAGANSVENPSGNSLVNTSPSGSTLMPDGASGGRR